MKFSTTGQEKYDLLIQVTSWTGLTVLKESYGQQFHQYQRSVQLNLTSNH